MRANALWIVAFSAVLGCTPGPNPADGGTDNCSSAQFVEFGNGADITVDSSGAEPVYVNPCVSIPANKTIGWYMDFAMHPLRNGGEAGTPIPSLSTGNDSGRVAFPNVGEYDFNCNVHSVSMRGTIKVH